MNFKNARIWNSDEKAFFRGGIRCGENGRILDFSVDSDAVDLGGAYVIPGLVDIHTHGRAGHDFTEASAKDLREMARSYAKIGTTTVVPTYASAPFASLLATIRASEGQREPRDGGCRYLGVHLEGRYLSSVRRGAHAEELLAGPDTDELSALMDAANGRPLRISMAPELPGAGEFMKAALNRGVRIGMAHTDADFATAMDAVAQGTSVFTHLFNAMRPFHHRDPGTVGAGLLSDAYVELICDGFHLHDGSIRLAARCKAKDKIVLITDSMAGAGCADGEYAIAGIPVTVKNGQAINADGAIAGSTLDLFDGLCRFVQTCQPDLCDALDAVTRNPAKCAGIDRDVGSLEIGKYADFLVICPERVTITKVVIGGRVI